MVFGRGSARWLLVEVHRVVVGGGVLGGSWWGFIRWLLVEVHKVVVGGGM